ncbi:unnamed protein product, partial [Symbiodinium sp. CCMP2456]
MKERSIKNADDLEAVSYAELRTFVENDDGAQKATGDDEINSAGRCGETATQPQKSNTAECTTENVAPVMADGGSDRQRQAVNGTGDLMQKANLHDVVAGAAGIDVDNQETLPWGCDGGEDTVNLIELAECEAFAADLAKEYEYREAQAEAKGAEQGANVQPGGEKEG